MNIIMIMEVYLLVIPMLLNAAAVALCKGRYICYAILYYIIFYHIPSYAIISYYIMLYIV